MFESLKGMASLASVMKDMPRIRARMQEVRQRLGERRVTVEHGGGTIRVTATGFLRIESIELSPNLPSGPDSAAMITDAVNDALAQARQVVQTELNAAAAELGLPLSPEALTDLMT